MALAWRLPRKMSWCANRSCCQQWHIYSYVLCLIPIFSLILNRKCCRYCGNPAPWRYPAGEMIAALASSLVVLRVGPWMESLPLFLLIPLLLTSSVIDLSHRYLPDGLTVAIAVLGVAASCFGLSVHLKDGIISSITAGIGTSFLRIMLGYYLRREALGWGDVKLFTAAGLWININQLPFLILISAVLGLLFYPIFHLWNAEREMPLGPTIAVTLYLLLLYAP